MNELRWANKRMRAALYARVSTADKQEPENQRAEFNRYIETRSSAVERIVYVEKETATGKRRRPVFEQMMYDAERRHFDLLVVWALDRLTREGPLQALLIVQRLHSAGVKVKSLREPWLDPESPTYELLLPIFAWVAKQEALRISERTKAGLARVRAQGVKLGRPRVAPDADLIRARRAQGASWRAIARELKLSAFVCQRAVRSA